MGTLNYNHLRYFWSVAREGNLTRAAAKLNLSQSALSLQIKKLEERLGHPLFERQGRGLVLTEAGRISFDYASSIFTIGDELLETLRESGTARRILRVGALATLSRNFQLAFLRPVLVRPDVETILRSGSSGELLAALGALQLDVVLTNQFSPPADGGGFIVHRIDEQPVSLIGAHGRRRKKALSAILAEEPLILPTQGNRIRSDFDALVDRLKIKPQIAAEVDDMAMMRLLVREGIGLAAIAPIVVKDELASRVLQEIARLPGISETFLAVTVKRRFSNPLVVDLLGEF
jgi:LysR family transcriptional activator of nhaA